MPARIIAAKRQTHRRRRERTAARHSNAGGGGAVSGKPVAVVMSSEDYDTIEAFKTRYLKAELARSLNDEAAGKIEDFDSFYNDLMAGKYD